jgi:hypothetical protein
MLQKRRVYMCHLKWVCSEEKLVKRLEIQSEFSRGEMGRKAQVFIYSETMSKCLKLPVKLSPGEIPKKRRAFRLRKTEEKSGGNLYYLVSIYFRRKRDVNAPNSHRILPVWKFEERGEMAMKREQKSEDLQESCLRLFSIFVGETLRFHRVEISANRSRLSRILLKLLRRRNWAESGKRLRESASIYHAFSHQAKFMRNPDHFGHAFSDE